MAGGAVIAGIGCRRGCTAADIAGAVRAAEAAAGRAATGVAAPWFRRDEAGVAAAAAALGLPLAWVEEDAMRAAQDGCVTRSALAEAAVGFASVAEAAALAASALSGPGGRLVRPRVAFGGATCALAAVGG